MASYRLTADEVFMLCRANFNTTYYRTFNYFKTAHHSSKEVGWENPDQFLSSQKPMWDRNLFTPLLAQQPELKPIVEEFWEKCKVTEYIDYLAGELFNGKIELKNVKHLIFNYNSNDIGAATRREFLKSIIVNSPSIVNDLHQHLKTSSYIDSELILVYLESLSKHWKQINDSQENILKNVAHSKKFSESRQIGILKSLVKIFPHNESLYEFLRSHFSSKFETFHNLRKTFYEYENKYFPTYKVKKPIGEYFTSIQQYCYTLTIKDSTLIDHFGVSKDYVGAFNKYLHDSIKKIVTEKIGSHVFYTHSAKGLEIKTENFEDKPLIENFMNHMKDDLYYVLSSLDLEQKKRPETIPFEDLIRATMLKNELNENLSVNPPRQEKKMKL